MNYFKILLKNEIKKYSSCHDCGGWNGKCIGERGEATGFLRIYKGDGVLDNVRASVVRNQKAPLLLGQSVLGRLGKIEIDNPGQKLVISHKVNKR